MDKPDFITKSEPRPWRISSPRSSGAKYGSIVNGPMVDPIAYEDPRYEKLTPEERDLAAYGGNLICESVQGEHTRKFIVHAANAFEVMLDALKGIAADAQGAIEDEMAMADDLPNNRAIARWSAVLHAIKEAEQ